MVNLITLRICFFYNYIGMKLEGLNKKDKKQVKALLSELNFLGIQYFLIERDLYEQHNRSELLLETLLFGDYRSAEELVDEYHDSNFDYLIISVFGDENVFASALYCLPEWKAMELSFVFLEMQKKAYMPEEKIFQIVKFGAFNKQFLNELCTEKNKALFEVFIDQCIKWKFEEFYLNVLSSVSELLIREKNFTLLKILVKKTALDEHLINQMNDDQFAWYVTKHPVGGSVIEDLLLNNREAKFKALIRSRDLPLEQLEECLFYPERFHFFEFYVNEKRLPEELERKLFYKGMTLYRQCYLRRYEISFWKRMKYFWTEN